MSGLAGDASGSGDGKGDTLSPETDQAQQQDSTEENLQEDLEEDDDDDSHEDLQYYYYSFSEEIDEEGRQGQLNNNEDPEFFAFECLTRQEAESFILNAIQALVTAAVQQANQRLTAGESRLCLLNAQWSLSAGMDTISNLYPHSVMAPNDSLGVSNAPMATSTMALSSHPLLCDVCATEKKDFSQLQCGHRYCQSCWEMHFEYQILQGISTGISCMSNNCDRLAPEEFVMCHLKKPELRDRYNFSCFQSCVQSHPLLRFCPGRNCKIIIKCVKPLAKRSICSTCKSTFCFRCGCDYHAPTDCDTIKRWLTKCADDSETANYISAHTKDCPKCNICIEKNGGCNHMQCYNCKHDFCWMCLGDWKTHGSEYYECSRYKENPNIAHESAHAQAREALKKYLHYFERWENHSKSMKLEAQTLEKIKSRITDKVMSGAGTWIDWQYLLDASALLAKCRYTLQYTYPYAYYMEPCPRKELFEYQQAQLEAEIENLSWKIEHAETTDRGDLENQIDIAEKRRTSLLKDFLSS